MSRYQRAAVVCALVVGSCLTVTHASASAPILTYDPDLGFLIVDTNNSGMLSLLVTGPQSLSIDRWLNNTFQDNVFWAQQYFGGKEQWIGLNNTPVADGVYQVATYAPGLTDADFGEVEVGTFDGDILFTSVTVIPEPGSLALLGLGGLALIARRRRSA